jgi:hypothetical protein
VIGYRLTQLRDDLAQFTSLQQTMEELVYVELVREQAEAIDAQTRAFMQPTAGNHERAIRETEEAIGISHLFISAIRSGRRLLHLA